MRGSSEGCCVKNIMSHLWSKQPYSFWTDFLFWSIALLKSWKNGLKAFVCGQSYKLHLKLGHQEHTQYYHITHKQHGFHTGMRYWSMWVSHLRSVQSSLSSNIRKSLTFKENLAVLQGQPELLPESFMSFSFWPTLPFHRFKLSLSGQDRNNHIIILLQFIVNSVSGKHGTHFLEHAMPLFACAHMCIKAPMFPCHASAMCVSLGFSSNVIIPVRVSVRMYEYVSACVFMCLLCSGSLSLLKMWFRCP